MSTAHLTAASKVFQNCFRFAGLGIIVFLTNAGLLDRLTLLAYDRRFGTVAIIAAVWSVSIAALIIVALEPRRRIRLFWGALIAISGSVAFCYRTSSGGEMTLYEAQALWLARGEAGHALVNYYRAVVESVVVFGASLALFAVPSNLVAQWPRKVAPVAAAFPMLPIALLSAIMIVKQGGGSLGLPKQFLGIAIGAVVTTENVAHPKSVRARISWKPNIASSVRKIVLMVDESVRYDYLDPEGRTGETPEITKVAAKLVDFGPTASSSICSGYSNAILRFTSSRRDLGGHINTNPTIWQYAKAAGYRTVYIDAQALHVSSEGHLQNFMMLGETANIDRLYRINQEPQQADRELLNIVVEELKANVRVFIYANKYGTHFPYDSDYPIQRAVNHPTNSELSAGKLMSAETLQSHVASYKNAILWNVDWFFGEFFRQADLSNTAMVYTSDHGQSLEAHGLTHCVTSRPLPQMALVPLYAFTDLPDLQNALQRGAALSRNRASHFQIVPTILSWMGYTRENLSTLYDESLTEGTVHGAAYTTGDVFGEFAQKTVWHPIDLARSFRENPAADELDK